MKKICYYPELVSVTGSVTSALMMSQLEFWFKVTEGESFYKFLEPCKHELYRVGDSWQEELGMSTSELRSAFKHIGAMYKSKSSFEQSKDLFQGKLYAAYYDRIRRTTHYFRNTEKVELILSGFEGEGCEMEVGQINRDAITESVKTDVKNELVNQRWNALGMEKSLQDELQWGKHFEIIQNKSLQGDGQKGGDQEKRRDERKPIAHQLDEASGGQSAYLCDELKDYLESELHDYLEGKSHNGIDDNQDKDSMALRLYHPLKGDINEEINDEVNEEMSQEINDEVSIEINGAKNLQHTEMPNQGAGNLKSVSSRNEEEAAGLIIKDLNQDFIQDNQLRRQEERLTPTPYLAICKLYNEHLGEALGYKSELVAREKQAMASLWSKFGQSLEAFKAAFVKVAASSFLCGKVAGRKWRASLEWLLKGEHFRKVIEGYYDDFEVKKSQKVQQNGAQKVSAKIQAFNHMYSHDWDFEEIECLERLFIERKLAGGMVN